LAGSRLEGRWDRPKRAASYFAEHTVALPIGVTKTWFASAEDDPVGGSVIDHPTRVEIRQYRERLKEQHDNDYLRSIKHTAARIWVNLMKR
jgi:hypothetical protein